jgi:hypothetical protein
MGSFEFSDLFVLERFFYQFEYVFDNDFVFNIQDFDRVFEGGYAIRTGYGYRADVEVECFMQSVVAGPFFRQCFLCPDSASSSTATEAALSCSFHFNELQAFY